MKKENVNQILREHSKSNLTPTERERNLVSSVYTAIKTALGDSCLLVGSYARFTAITPLHDIDILFIAGEFAPHNINPKPILDRVGSMIRDNFINPTRYAVKISLQTHSIGIIFLENGEEILAVDIVPAYISDSKNEFGDDIYFVPQILNTNRRYRLEKYTELNKSIVNEIDWWIKSDPHGYITAAHILNSKNNDFRKTVKFVKRWKHNCKEKDPSFKLKSFHIEQVLFEFFRQNTKLEITEAVFRFFCSIPDVIKKAQIKDRADQSRFIDDYVNNLTTPQRERIIEARDGFLIELESITQLKPVSSLLNAGFYKRACTEEQYLFDFSIPVFIDEGIFKIDGKVLPKQGCSDYWLSAMAGRVAKGRNIKFQIMKNTTNASSYKWKVKNDNSSPQPRGEITNHQTHNNPESTAYTGNHYVECYAIRNNICIAKSRSNVIIE